jgi:hypothetical protein
MIETIEGLPEGVIGWIAHGKLTAEDYKNVLEPALNAHYESGSKPNVLFEVAPDFDGVSGSGMWEDVRFGIRHLTGWGKIAIVGDGGWIVRTTDLAAHLFPQRLRSWPREGRDAAIAWLADPNAR